MQIISPAVIRSTAPTLCLVLLALMISPTWCSSAASTLDTSSSASGDEWHMIDACVAVHNAMSTAPIVDQEEEVAILANVSASRHNKVAVQFINCNLPINVRITIVVVQPAQKRTESDALQLASSNNNDHNDGAVFIDVTNTTMRGGALIINTTEPENEVAEQAQQAGGSFLSITNVHVRVEGAVLEAVGDVLVVDTRRLPRNDMGSNVTAVTLNVRNAIITSQEGGVLSVLCGRTSFVDDVRIHVGGNSTLHAERVVATVAARTITNTFLAVNNSDDGNAIGCRNEGSIKMSAGNASTNDEVGVLSFLPPLKHSPAILSLHNVSIAVVFLHCTKSRLNISSVTSEGIAASVGVCARDKGHAELHLSGHISIVVQLVSAPPSPEDNTQQNGTTEDTNVEEPTVVAITATVVNVKSTNFCSAVAVGGISVVTYWRESTHKNTLVALRYCTLNIHFGAIGESDSRSVGSVQATAEGRRGVSSVFAVVILRYASIQIAVVTPLSVSHGSNVTITSIIHKMVGHTIVLAATSSRQSSLSGVLGVSLLFDSCNDGKIAMVSVSHGSTINIGSSVQNGSNVSMSSSATRQGLAVAGVLGLAIRTDCNSKDGTALVQVDHQSRVSIASEVANATLLVQVDAVWKTATTVLGVAMTAYSYHNVIAASLVITHGSALSIVSTVRQDGRLFIDVSNYGSATAVSTLGIAVTAQSIKSPPRLDFIVSIDSRITIATQFSSSMSTERPTSVVAVRGGYEGAVSTAGVAMLACRARTKRGGVINTIINGSITVENYVVGTEMLAEVFKENWNMAVATAGVVLIGDVSSSLVLGGSGQLTLWAAAANSSVLNATGSQNTTSLGVLVSTFVDTLVTNRNDSIAIAFCGDGSVVPLAPEGIVMEVSPSTTNALVETTASWGAAVGSSASACTTKAEAVTTTIHDVISAFDWGSLWSPWVGRSDHHQPATTRTPTSSDIRTPSISLSEAKKTASITNRSPRTKTNTLTTTVERDITTPTVTPSLANEQPPTNQPPPPSPNPTLARPTPEPEPPKRTVTIVSSVMMSNEEGATVVLSTAGASNAVSSTLGSGGAGVLVVASSSVRMLECGLAEDDPKPALFELPIQFSIGSSSMRYFAGAVLGHTLVQCILFTMPVLYRRHVESRNKIVSVFGMIFCGSHAFFTPAILGACSTVLNSEVRDEVGVAVAAVCGCVILGIHVVVTNAVQRGPQNGIVATSKRSIQQGQKVKLEFDVQSSSSSLFGSDSSSSKSDDDEMLTGSKSVAGALLFSGEATRDTLLTLFDGCREYEKVTHRHYASIETTIFSTIAMISGARPRDHCNYAAFVMGCLAMGHLLYIVLIRPFRTALDTTFSILNSALLVVLSMSVAIAFQQRKQENTNGERSDHEQWILRVVEACLWLISVLGFIQLGVQGYWAHHVVQRRKLNAQAAGSSDSSSSSSSDDADEELDKRDRRPHQAAEPDDDDDEDTEECPPPPTNEEDNLSQSLLHVVEHHDDADRRSKRQVSRRKPVVNDADGECAVQMNPLHR